MKTTVYKAVDRLQIEADDITINISLFNTLHIISVKNIYLLPTVLSSNHFLYNRNFRSVLFEFYIPLRYIELNYLKCY